MITCVAGQKFSSIITHPKVLNSLAFVSKIINDFLLLQNIIMMIVQAWLNTFLKIIKSLFVKETAIEYWETALLKYSLVCKYQIGSSHLPLSWENENMNTFLAQIINS